MWIAKKYKQLGVGVKASIVYTVASLLTKGLAIITTPIYKNAYIVTNGNSEFI